MMRSSPRCEAPRPASSTSVHPSSLKRKGSVTRTLPSTTRSAAQPVSATFGTRCSLNSGEACEAHFPSRVRSNVHRSMRATKAEREQEWREFKTACAGLGLSAREFAHACALWGTIVGRFMPTVWRFRGYLFQACAAVWKEARNAKPSSCSRRESN